MTPATPARLRYPQAADYLHVSERQLRRLVANRRIGFVKLGNYTEFTVDQLDAYIAAHTFTPEQQS